MKKIFFMSVFILLFAGIVLAEGESDSTGKEICDYIINDLGVKVGTAVPDGVPFSDEIFNFYTKDDSVIGHVTLKDGLVSEFNCQNVSDNTYTVLIESKQTLEDIISSDKPVSEFGKKITTKEIVIEGETLGKIIKNFFMKIGIIIAGWFD